MFVVEVDEYWVGEVDFLWWKVFCVVVVDLVVGVFEMYNFLG